MENQKIKKLTKSLEKDNLELNRLKRNRNSISARNKKVFQLGLILYDILNDKAINYSDPEDMENLKKLLNEKL